ncbi:MAG: hypothetical protein HY811_00420 [Planctomycetes bacterium]|nr:hypothetical protein [Planctomycetota bacterium]
MCKTTWKWLAGALILALVAGFSPNAQAKDNQEKENSGKHTEANSNDEEKSLTVDDMINEDLAKDGLAIDDDISPEETADNKNTEEAKPPKKEHKGPDVERRKQEHEEAIKKCQGMGCKVPKCPHDWSKYRLNLTDEQKTRIAHLKEEINDETIGMNWCTLTAARHKLEELRKDKKAFPKQIESAKATVKMIHDAMQRGYKKFNENYRNLILTNEQRELLKEKDRAMKEHMETCKPHHNPDCPFHLRDDKHSRHNVNEGNFIKYCNDEKHLSEGLFECPRNYRELMQEERKNRKEKPENPEGKEKK